MRLTFPRTILAGAVVTSALIYGALEAAPAPPTNRTVYVTVVDNQGQMAPGLAAADFTVREGGRDREILSVEPAREKMRIALAVEETLTPLGGVRQGLGDFMQKMASLAEVELVIVGQSNRVAVPATSDLNTFYAGINALPLAQRQSQLNHVPEGIGDLARGFTKSKPERPVIVIVAMNTLQASNEEPQNILNALRDSNAQFHSVVIEVGASAGSNPAENMEAAGRAQVLGDGPRQSGGRQWAVTALTAIPKVMQQIAGELSAQYKITYVLPDGQKPSDRVEVRTSRRGVTLRAPSRISAR
jgi:hypothetical protein